MHKYIYNTCMFCKSLNLLTSVFCLVSLGGFFSFSFQSIPPLFEEKKREIKKKCGMPACVGRSTKKIYILSVGKINYTYFSMGLVVVVGNSTFVVAMFFFFLYRCFLSQYFKTSKKMNTTFVLGFSSL